MSGNARAAAAPKEVGINTVRAVMSPMPAPIDGMATVHEALELMRENNVYSLVVERRRPGDEYGMVVVSDIANKVIADNRSPDRVNVYEIMSKPVLTISADMEIKYAIRLLGRFGLSRSVVVDGNEAVGFVTLTDMVFRFYEQEAMRREASG
ncbi:MAG: CBS domain-containing protein [Chloroflexi bacterium]|nr:CBS domain-containing protein [Chloroflexota bacterium]